MNRRQSLALFFLAPFACPAATTLEAAQQRLRTAVDEVLALADQVPSRAVLEQRIPPLLVKHMSFAVMTRRAVGPGWRQFNAEQQQQATALFSKLITRSYCSKFKVGQRPEIKFGNAVETAAGRVDIATTTTYQGNRYAVVYRLEAAEGWRTTDVVIEGVSMVANYRSQLDSVFKRGGAAAVINSLSQSVARPE